MGIESATYISQLVGTNPVAGDDYSTADDHLRLVKNVLKAQFANFTAAAVTATVAELNKLTGATLTTAELNKLAGATLLTADLNLLTGAAAASVVAADIQALAGIAAGGVTPSEIIFLNGVTSAIQTQLNGKAASSHAHSTADITSGTFADARIAATNVTQHVGAINHNALLNYVADQHIAHSGVSISPGVGMSGGGTIAANRTLTWDPNGLTQATGDAADLDADVVAGYDSSAAAQRKFTASKLVTPEIGTTVAGTTDTLDEADFGKLINYSSTSPITVTLPDGLKTGFWSVLRKTGASGTLTLSATTTYQARSGYSVMSAQYGVVTVFHLGANVWTAWGDLES